MLVAGPWHVGVSWESKRNARDSKNKHGRDGCGRESDGNSVGRLVPLPTILAVLCRNLLSDVASLLLNRDGEEASEGPRVGCSPLPCMLLCILPLTKATQQNQPTSSGFEDGRRWGY